MKTVFVLALTISVAAFVSPLEADTSATRVSGHVHQNNISQIEDDSSIPQGPGTNSSHVSTWDGSGTQTVPCRSDPVLYLTNAYGIMALPAVIGDKQQGDTWTLMIAGKFSRTGNISPFICVGAGVMPSPLDVGRVPTTSSTEYGKSISDADPHTKACGKLGAGIDYSPTEHISVGLEGSYVFGLGDFDLDIGSLRERDMDILYFVLTLGAAYHF
jgi:opacity protein-like surface antigen